MERRVREPILELTLYTNKKTCCVLASLAMCHDNIVDVGLSTVVSL